MISYWRELFIAIAGAAVVALIAATVHAHLVIVLAVAAVGSLGAVVLLNRWTVTHPDDSESILFRRLYRVINRLYLCSNNREDRYPIQPPDPYGLDVDITKTLVQRKKWYWRFWTWHRWPYTQLVKHRLRIVLKGLGAQGVVDNYLKRYVVEPPPRDQLNTVASTLHRVSGNLKPGMEAARRSVDST